MDDKLREIEEYRRDIAAKGWRKEVLDMFDYLIEQAKKLEEVEKLPTRWRVSSAVHVQELLDELEAILTLPQKEDAECTCRPNPYNKFHSEPPLLTDVNCPIHGKKDSPEVEKVDWTSFEAGYLPTQHTFHNAILELKRWVGKNRRWIGWFENYEWKSGREELAGCIQALEKRVDANSDLRETIERLAYRNKHRIKALEDIVNLPGA